jgi:hypothetical protein
MGGRFRIICGSVFFMLPREKTTFFDRKGWFIKKILKNFKNIKINFDYTDGNYVNIRYTFVFFIILPLISWGTIFLCYFVRGV